MAPRGIVAAAVAAVFALRMSAEGYEEAGLLVPITFLVIIGTVLFSSLVAPTAAHRLGLADPDPQGVLVVGAHAWGRAVAEAIQKQGFRVLLVDTNRGDLAAARMAGLPTYNESILAEHLLDDVNLGGIGRLIAATPNDWVNILAVHRFARVFGRRGVYQIPPRKRRDADDDAHRHLHGRWLFGEEISHAELTRRMLQGAVIKTTPITEEFTMESFQEHYGTKAIPLFVVTESKRLVVVSADQVAEPKAGETLISLVESEEEATERRSDEATKGE
jgi:Trk K+ transport system NAD-binding subunit